MTDLFAAAIDKAFGSPALLFSQVSNQWRTRTLMLILVGWLTALHGITQEKSTAESNPSRTSESQIPPLPDLSVPKNSNRSVLEKFIETVKKTQAQSPEQYRQLQVALRDASNQLFAVINDSKDVRSVQAELDSLAASAALMVNESEEAREKVLERMTKYLSSRDELSMTDIKTGTLVGLYLEMQPRKAPARDLYALLNKLLEKDKRADMQSIRMTLQANIRRLELLGNKIEIDATTTSGLKVTTSSFAGKFLLLSFFTTWSQPCVTEIQRLEQYREKYAARGLEVVGVSLDADKKSLEKVLSEKKITFPIIHDLSSPADQVLSAKYGVMSLPTTFLVNKEGDVVSLEAYGPELDRLMQKLFEEPTPAPPQASPLK